MAIDVQVIFTGLALFCLNETGHSCAGGLDTVYLVNASHDAEVCGRELDGGHHPVLAFDARHLRPGTTQSHHIVPTPEGGRLVVSDLDGVELCICTEDEDSPGCRRAQPGDPGATEIDMRVDRQQQDPSIFRRDESSFDWVPNLAHIHSGAAGQPLCAEAEDPLPNPLVSSRVHLDKGTVLTPQGWQDVWGSWIGRVWRRVTEQDFMVWQAMPDSNVQSHFPRAMPGRAGWFITGIPDDAIILLQDCHPGRPQRTLFRLGSKGTDIRVHITNAPETKHPLATGLELEHFRWYYRLIDWPQVQGCTDRNREASSCPPDLPVPFLPAGQIERIVGQGWASSQQRSPLKPTPDDVEGVITQTIKCPPANSG